MSSNNVAKNNRFEFHLAGFKELSYRVQTSSLGSINLGGSMFATRYADIMVPSNKVDFSFMTMRVLLSEDFSEWQDAIRWAYELVKTNASHLEPAESTGTLFILNANQVPVMEVTYHGCAPVATSEISMTLVDDEETLGFDLSISYDSMDVKNLITGETIVYSE